MQDRYVGDIGDFGKYLLLKSLCKNNNIKLGVNWCYVNHEYSTKEKEKNDGKYTGYLYQKNNKHKVYKETDEILINQLRNIVESEYRTYP